MTLSADQLFTAYGRFHGRCPYGGIPTKKETNQNAAIYLKITLLYEGSVSQNRTNCHPGSPLLHVNQGGSRIITEIKPKSLMTIELNYCLLLKLFVVKRRIWNN